MSCCEYSTIEGESELSTDQGTEQLHNLYPYQGADHILLLYTGTLMRDLAVEQHSTQSGLMLNCSYRANTVSNPEKMHNMPYIALD